MIWKYVDIRQSLRRGYYLLKILPFWPVGPIICGICIIGINQCSLNVTKITWPKIQYTFSKWTMNNPSVYTKRRQFTENLYLYLHFTNISNETPPVQGVALTVYAPTRNQKETRKRRFIWNVSFHTGLSDVIVFNNLHNVLDFAEFLIQKLNEKCVWRTSGCSHRSYILIQTHQERRIRGTFL